MKSVCKNKRRCARVGVAMAYAAVVVVVIAISVATAMSPVAMSALLVGAGLAALVAMVPLLQ